ncbi:MAG: type II toxin-antitoxin system HicB family antitoxin [Microcystaceae cyanobacterium]
MNLTVELEQEEDGRWIAEIIGLPGVLAYAQTSDEAMIKVQVLALRVAHLEGDRL